MTSAYDGNEYCGSLQGIKGLVILTETPSDNWVTGVFASNPNIGVQAKIFSEGSSYGIKGGRISKLSIWDRAKRDSTHNFLGACFVNYDRGWDIRPTKAPADVKDLYTKFVKAIS